MVLCCPLDDAIFGLHLPAVLQWHLSLPSHGWRHRHSHEVLVFAVLTHQLLGFLSHGTVFVNEWHQGLN
jgi:hypothetical protein